MSGAPGGELVIGLDSSTSAVKALAWSPAGQLVAAGRAPLELYTPRPDFYEQAAQDWWDSACLALRQALAAVPAGAVKAVCIAHQRETFVPLGFDLQPLRPALTWLDQRARLLLPDLAARLDPVEFHRRTGKPLSANLAPPKIAWLREFEPDVFAQTAYWLDTHAYLVQRLTGELATSSASADPLGLFDLSRGCWDEPTLQLLGLDPRRLPAVFAPGSPLGAVTAQAAAATGLPAGTPVVAGMGDGQAAALGIGAQASGHFSLSLGTSVIGGAFSPRFNASPAFRTMGGPPGFFVLETVILSGAHLLNWLVQDLLGRRDLAAVFAELESSAAEIPPGAQGLFLVPYWNGALNPYWDANASGIITGLRGHHRPAHLFRAALEGIAYELRLHLEGIETELATPLPALTASGGGVRSPLWLQIIADVTGKSVFCNEENEAAALGAGILAATAAGLHPDLPSAARAMSSPPRQVYRPDASAHAFYSEAFRQSYRRLYPAVRGA